MFRQNVFFQTANHAYHRVCGQTKMHLGADLREGESLIENIVNEAMHDILESDEFDKLLETSN